MHITGKFIQVEKKTVVCKSDDSCLMIKKNKDKNCYSGDWSTICNSK